MRNNTHLKIVGPDPRTRVICNNNNNSKFICAKILKDDNNPIRFDNCQIAKEKKTAMPKTKQTST